MPKDRDVWDPPEDVEFPEPPLSAFKQHFQGRAITVGKDGTNAQLVQMKVVKPIKWSKGKKEEALERQPVNIIAHKRGVSGAGIVAPDEISEVSRRTLPKREASSKILGGNDVIARKADAVPVRSNATGVWGGVATQVMEPNKKNVVSQADISSHSSNDRKITQRVNRQENLWKSSTPEIVSVETIENNTVATGERIKNAVSAPQALQSLHRELAERQQQPFSRIPPRRLSERDELMPHPLRIAKKLVKDEPECIEVDMDNNVIEEEHDAHSGDLDTSGDTRGALEVLPMYRPLGLLYSPLQLIKKKNAKNTNKSCSRVSRQRTSASRHHSAPAGQNTKPQPFTENAQRPVPSLSFGNKLSAVSPLVSPSRAFYLEPARATSSTRTDTTLTDDLEKQRKKPITYKPHTMKDYKEIMEKVVNMKRGGLGPADTDEQRQAKEKMTRQREYGERVERQTIDELHEKNQQRLSQQQQDSGEEGHPQREAPKVIRQPLRPEQIQAKERRARALAYARSVPRPEPATAPKSAEDASSEVLLSPERRNPRDEMEWRREQHIRDLEIRHQRDRETLEYVKRQMGNLKKH